MFRPAYLRWVPVFRLGAAILACAMSRPTLAGSIEQLTNASALCQRGDSLFRQAALDEAAGAYQAAREADPASARACWGLGRIASMEFRQADARKLFSMAHRLDPTDPAIAESYASVSAGARPRLASPIAEYKLKLTGFRPSGSTALGVIITARINGARTLRLILDTGARGIFLHGKAVRDVGLETLGESRIGGLGSAHERSSRAALARTISFGDLEYRDCRVEVLPAAVSADVDGVIGTGIFQDFAIRIDPIAMTLQLAPPADTVASTHRAYSLNGLLLVKTRINRGREGLFLIDTGAAFTSVEANVGRRWANPSSSVAIAGAQGLLGQALRMSPVSLEVAGRTLVDSGAIAVNLQKMSEAEGIEISGLLGFSVLGKAPLTLDYRNGAIQLGH